jgi:hypothetical protein
MSDLITMLSAASGAGGAEEADPNFNQTVLPSYSSTATVRTERRTIPS